MVDGGAGGGEGDGGSDHPARSGSGDGSPWSRTSASRSSRPWYGPGPLSGSRPVSGEAPIVRGGQPLGRAGSAPSVDDGLECRGGPRVIGHDLGVEIDGGSGRTVEVAMAVLAPGPGRRCPSRPGSGGCGSACSAGTGRSGGRSSCSGPSRGPCPRCGTRPDRPAGAWPPSRPDRCRGCADLGSGGCRDRRSRRDRGSDDGCPATPAGNRPPRSPPTAPPTPSPARDCRAPSRSASWCQPTKLPAPGSLIQKMAFQHRMSGPMRSSTTSTSRGWRHDGVDPGEWEVGPGPLRPTSEGTVLALEVLDGSSSGGHLVVGEDVDGGQPAVRPVVLDLGTRQRTWHAPTLSAAGLDRPAPPPRVSVRTRRRIRPAAIGFRTDEQRSRPPRR